MEFPGDYLQNRAQFIPVRRFFHPFISYTATFFQLQNLCSAESGSQVLTLGVYIMKCQVGCSAVSLGERASGY